MTNAEQAQQKPWRKRHPVLSRFVLYVLGAGLIATLLLLFFERKDVDRADELQALREELDALALVMAADSTGHTVLAVLDKKFADADLPPELRGHALRWRAMALRRMRDAQAAEAALEAASALDLPARDRLALRVEWAETRIEARDLVGALKVLPPITEEIDGPLGLLRDRVYAHAHVELDAPDAGIRLLASRLAELRGPLPDQPVDFVGGRPWTMAEAATVATELLAAHVKYDREKPWLRLARLAADDFDAQVAAARGLAHLARREDALRVWRRAQVLDAAGADSEAARDPALADLAGDGR